MATIREASKNTWESNSTVEHINCGSLQRIADATEKMASSYVALEKDRDLYKKWYNDSAQRNRTLERKNAALRGVITKLKAKATTPR